MFLIGSGGNGKSVYLNTLSRIMDDGTETNITSIEPSMFQDKFALGQLKDKLLNISSEIDTKSPVASNILKKMISGETIQADRKYDPNAFIFRPIAKHIFSMNEAPVITDKTFGFERRIIIVRFNRRFTGKDADKLLSKKLAEEVSGIFNWMLIGLKRVVETEEIFESERVRKDRQTFLKMINPMTSFVDEMAEFNQEFSIEKSYLYRKYSEWCEDSGVRRLSKMRFYSQLLDDYSMVTEKKGVGNVARKFHGIGLNFKENI